MCFSHLMAPCATHERLLGSLIGVFNLQTDCLHHENVLFFISMTAHCVRIVAVFSVMSLHTSPLFRQAGRTAATVGSCVYVLKSNISDSGFIAFLATWLLFVWLLCVLLKNYSQYHFLCRIRFIKVFAVMDFS